MTPVLILPGDTVWSIAARTLSRSGYASYAAYVAAIVARNPGLDWTALPVGQSLLVPA
jgi:Tfp pilus assembly protein FimV